MISVIICSANASMLAKLRLNVEVTIQTPYEILAFDNLVQKKGIGEVYNLMAAKAAYGILCFVHEDVVIHTKGWGRIMQKLLADKAIGLVGISGAVYKSNYPGTWAACHQSLYRTHSIQHFKHLAQPVITNINPANDPYAEVAVIDGVLMATRKDVFDVYQFDEKLLNGFHGYDLDYALQVGQQYKVVVTYELLLEHLSEGVLNSDWLKASLLIHKKWKKELPKMALSLDKKIKSFSDYLSIQCMFGMALKDKGRLPLVIGTYFTLVTKYFEYNKLKYTRQVFIFLTKPFLNL